MPKPGQPTVGDAVVHVDEVGKSHDALVTNSFGDVTDPDNTYAVNLVYVNKEDGATDQYGQQLVRKSSVPPQRWQSAPGNYWRWPLDEKPSE